MNFIDLSDTNRVPMTRVVQKLLPLHYIGTVYIIVSWLRHN